MFWKQAKTTVKSAEAYLKLVSCYMFMGVLLYVWEAYSLEGRMGENIDKRDEKSIAIN